MQRKNLLKLISYDKLSFGTQIKISPRKDRLPALDSQFPQFGSKVLVCIDAKTKFVHKFNLQKVNFFCCPVKFVRGLSLFVLFATPSVSKTLELNGSQRRHTSRPSSFFSFFIVYCVLFRGCTL